MGTVLALTGKMSSVTPSCQRRAVCECRGDQASWLPAEELHASLREGEWCEERRQAAALALDVMGRVTGKTHWEGTGIGFIKTASQHLLAKWWKGRGSAAGDHRWGGGLEQLASPPGLLCLQQHLLRPSRESSSTSWRNAPCSCHALWLVVLAEK